MRANLYFGISKSVKGLLRHPPYTVAVLKAHLESLFQPGMTWENRNLWDIDHKIPLKFKNIDGTYFWDQNDLSDPTSETFLKAWSLDNLQPMWKRQNIRKGNRWIG